MTADAVTVADCIDCRPPSTQVADDTYHRVVVVNADTLPPHAQTPLLAKSTSSGRKVVDPIENRASRAPLHVSKGIVDVITNMSFNIVLTKILNKPVHLSKRMIVAPITDSPAYVTVTETALLETVPGATFAVH